MMTGYEELSKIRTPPYRMRTISIIRLSLTESDMWLLTSCICEIDTKFCTNYKKGTRLCIRKKLWSQSCPCMLFIAERTK